MVGEKTCIMVHLTPLNPPLKVTSTSVLGYNTGKYIVKTIFTYIASELHVIKKGIIFLNEHRVAPEVPLYEGR